MLQKSVQVNRKILATPTVQCTVYCTVYCPVCSVQMISLERGFRTTGNSNINKLRVYLRNFLYGILIHAHNFRRKGFCYNFKKVQILSVIIFRQAINDLLRKSLQGMSYGFQRQEDTHT